MIYFVFIFRTRLEFIIKIEWRVDTSYLSINVSNKTYNFLTTIFYANRPPIEIKTLFILLARSKAFLKLQRLKTEEAHPFIEKQIQASPLNHLKNDRSNIEEKTALTFLNRYFLCFSNRTRHQKDRTVNSLTKGCFWWDKGKNQNQKIYPFQTLLHWSEHTG